MSSSPRRNLHFCLPITFLCFSYSGLSSMQCLTLARVRIPARSSGFFSVCYVMRRFKVRILTNPLWKKTLAWIVCMRSEQLGDGEPLLLWAAQAGSRNLSECSSSVLISIQREAARCHGRSNSLIQFNSLSLSFSLFLCLSLSFSSSLCL